MEEKRYTSIQEVVELPNYDSVTVSECGRYAAYVKKIPDWKKNEYRTNVWIYEVCGEKQYPLTTGNCESRMPAWSPASSYLAYVSKAGDEEESKNQIFIKTFDMYNGIQITSSNNDIDNFKWSPDGKGLFYTSSDPESREMKKRKELYGDFEYIDKENTNNSLYYIELDKAITKTLEDSSKPEAEKEDSNDIAVQLTSPKDFNISGFDISPDGKKAVMVCTPTGEARDDNTDLYLLELDTRKLTKLDFNANFYSYISFSPDGKKITFSKTPREKEYYKWRLGEDVILETYDIEKSEITMSLSDFDRAISIIKWTKKGILGCWQDKTSFSLGMISETGEIEIIEGGEFCYIGDVCITRDGENLIYIKAGKKETHEIYLNKKKITNGSRAYENKLLSRKEIVKWNSRDGLEIEGVLSTPQDFGPGKRYPLLLVVHGGPTWASFPIHNLNRLYPIEQFVEKGFIVLEPNYRGSAGYGSKFQASNFRVLGIGDYDDVISGVDMLIEKGMVDCERVGIMGWSQGGYISAFCSTYSNRFKAISVGAGISNWRTYYVNTDITNFTRSYLGATPWDDPEVYAKTSPMTYIKSACTPTLIQHGDSDKRVPVPNAFELYRGLQDLGVESELVIYKGMGHSPQKPGIHRAIMEQNLEWFLRCIK